MGALVTQSSLNAQLDEKKEQDLSLDLPENLAQNIAKTPQISVFDDEEYKNSLLNYQSSDDDKYFALALGEELESALKQGYSKKDIIAGLKKSDIFADDERNLRALDELTNSDDERLFDDILDYANSFKPKSEVDLKSQTLAALEAEKEALRSGGVPFGDTLEAKRYAELNKQIDELKFKREYEVKKQDSDKLDENASLLQKVAYYTNPVNLFSESTIGKALGGAADYAEKITIEKVFDNIQPQNENEAKIDENIRSFIYQAQNRGEKINAGILNEAETERLIKVAAFLGDDIDKAMISEKLYKMNDRQKNALIEKGLKFYEKEANIAQKDFNDLNDEEKDYILKKEGFLNRGWNALFNDDDTTIKEGLAKIKSGALGHILSEEVEAAKNFATQYNILHTGTNWLSGKLGANSEEESQRVREKFEQNLLNISDKIKADGVKISDETGKIYFFKNQDDGSVKYFEINEGFFDNFSTLLLNNKAAILGGIGGTILGVNQAKKGRFNRLGKGLSQTGGAIVGSFLGSTAGAVGDYFTYLQESGEDFDFDTFAWHATQEGILSLAADAVAIGAGKVLEKANIQGVKNAFGKITDYTPVVGFVKRAFSGNAQAVDKLIKQTYTDEQLSALKAFGESFGAELKLGEQSTKLSDDIALKFGEQHPFTKAAKTTYDIFSLPTQKEKQEAMLQAIRADETGNLIGFLIEVANSSPQLQVSMRNILNQTTMRIKNQLDNLGLKQGEIKEVFDEFEKGIKDGYEKAMSEILGKVYDDNFKTTISRQNYDNFRIELENSGILQESDLKFLNFVEKSIYNPSGVSFTQLNNALKNLNALFKETSPSFQTYTKNKVQGFLRDEIKAGIDDIFSQNKVFYQDAQALFSTALSDYTNMKEISKTLKKLKVRDESRTFEKALDDLVKYTQGQGLNDLSNLTKLTKNLSPDDAARVELSLLNHLFNQSLLSIKSGEKIVLEVFDSGKFLENLAKIGGEFNSLAARDFIDIINAFHKLYKNDIQIAQNLRAATTQRVGSSIATTIEGAVKFQIVRELFSQIIRLMPHIPFAKALNEKISGAALRFHLKSALKKSNSIGELKQTLNHSIQRGNFNSKTKELLTKINSEISQAQAEILEKEAFENTIAQNAKGDMQLYNTLKAYEVENLDLATPQTYEKFIDDILSEDLEKLQKAPNILYIADLNADLSQSLGLERAKIFLRKNDLHHFRPARKGEYKQDLNKDEFLEIPQALAQAKRAYIDPNNQNFFITFKDKADENKLNFLHINKDEQGNYIITAKKADIKTINNYKEVSAEGLAPTIPQGVKHSQEPSTTLTASTDTIDEIVTKQNLKEADLKKTKAKKIADDLGKTSDDELLRAEMKRLYNVVYNGDKVALIFKDLENINEAILLQKGDKRKGATHIRLSHTQDETQKGFVTPDEVQNIGVNVRKYLHEQKEPFIDKDNARIYEWQENGVKFRIVARDLENVSGGNSHLPSANEEIITFYSDRNVNEKMNFKNANLKTDETLQGTQKADLEAENAEIKTKESLESKKEVEATPSAPSLNESIEKNALKLDKAQNNLKENVNVDDLNAEQLGIYEVLTGKKDKIVLQGKDINDLYTLEAGSRTAGAKKILIKHAGLEKTGGVSNDELLDMMKVVRQGDIDEKSLTMFDNKIRYAYDLEENGAKLRLVVEEYNDGRKVFDFYSDRNFTPKDNQTQKYQNIKAEQKQEIKDESEAFFGKNYPEFKGKGQEAIQHLLKTKSGQVQGAFYRDDLGEISLVWGEAGTGKSDGWGLAKIAKYHNEVIDDLAELVENSPIVKESANRYHLETPNYKIVVRKDFDNIQEKWVLTAFEKKESIASRRTDLTSSQKSEVEKTTSTNTHKDNSSTNLDKNQAKDFEALQKEAQDYLDKRANFKRLKDEAYKAQLKIKELENIQEKINSQKENLELFKKNAQEFKDKFKDDKEARKREGVRIKDKKWRYYIDDYNTKIADYESWIKHFQKELEKAILERQTPQGQKALKEALQVVEDFNKAKAEFEAFDEMPTHLMPDPNDTLNKIIKIHPTQDELVEYFKNFVNDKNLPANKIIKSLFLDGVDYFKRANYPSAYIDFIPKILSDEKLLKEVIGEKFEKNSIKNIEVYKKHISKKESERLDEWAKRIKQYTIKGENNYKAINDDADKKQYSLKNLMTDRYNFQKFFNVIPNKEYGENYAEFYRDGQGAINKLINEAKDYEARKASDRLTTAEKEQGAYKGQVAEAFYRKDLEEMSGTGRIDLVWGDDNFGLKHILDKHEAEFKDIGKEISEAIENGKLINQNNVRFRIEYDNIVVGLSTEYKGEKQNFIITAFTRKGKADTFSEPPFKSTSHNAVDNPNADIIPNSSQKNQGKNLKTSQKDEILSLKQQEHIEIIDEKSPFKDFETFSPFKTPQLVKYYNNVIQRGQKAHDEIVNLRDEAIKKLEAKKQEFNEGFYKDEQIKMLDTAIKSIKNDKIQYMGNIRNYLLGNEWYNSEKELREVLNFVDEIMKEVIKDELEIHTKFNNHFIAIIKEPKKAVKVQEGNGDAFNTKIKRKMVQGATGYFNFNSFLEQAKKISLAKKQNINNSPASNFTELKKEHKLIDFYKEQLPQIRQRIEEFTATPNKEYGENYAEFYRDGQGAINKLINEAKDYEARKASDRLTTAEKEQGAYKGQVAEAFYRKDLEEMSGTGRIDLVWGDDNFGLKHILDKHEAEFKDIGKEISEIVESGKLVKDDKGRLRVETDNYVVGIKDNWKGEKTHNWIVTAYKKKEGGGSLYTSPHNHTSEILPETSSQIIPNQTAKSKSKEQKQAEKYYFQKEKEVEDFEKAKNQAQGRVYELENDKSKELAYTTLRKENFIKDAAEFKEKYKNISQARRAEGKRGENNWEKYVYHYEWNLNELDEYITQAKNEHLKAKERKEKELPQALKDLENARKSYEESKAEFEALPLPDTLIKLDFGGGKSLIVPKNPSEKEALKRFAAAFDIKLYGKEYLKNVFAEQDEIIKQNLKKQGYNDEWIDFYERLKSDEALFAKLYGEELDKEKRLLDSDNVTSWVKSYHKPEKEVLDERNAVQQERIKRATQRDLERISSEEYQQGLKEWAKGSSKHFLNDDGTPVMLDGLYYSDKHFFNDTFATKYSKEDLKSKHEDLINALKNAKTKQHKRQVLHEFGGFLEKKAVLNEGNFKAVPKLNERGISSNILQSNQHIGTGLVTGTLSGFETDENGNVSFNPARFVMGFVGGAGASKAVSKIYQNKIAQKHALKVVTNIQNNFKVLQDKNMPLFAKIMQDIKPNTFLKSTKEAEILSNEVFNKELKEAIINAIDKKQVQNLPIKKPFENLKEFKGLFDEVKDNQGTIKTPYKEINVNVSYAFNHFTKNTYNINRDNIKSAFFDTFKDPLFIVEFTPQGRTKPSAYFYKPYYDEKKQLLNLIGISVSDKGQLNFSTFYLDKKGNRLKEFLNKKEILIRYVKP